MNKKTGLISFHLDVDIFEDEKIQFVSARFGAKGEAITIRLLCKIYRQGYFTDWNEDIALLFSKDAGNGISPACANDVVYELLKRGFFDKGIFERFSILTSRRIQRQYFGASIRRNEAEYDPRYMLVDASAWKNSRSIEPINQNADGLNQNVDILAENVDGLKQSKVKDPPLPPLPHLPFAGSGMLSLPLASGSGTAVGRGTAGRSSQAAETKAELRAIRDSYVFAGKLHNAVNDWITYKHEKRQGYKPGGLKSLLSRIKNNAGRYGEEAVVRVIHESMANNYHGIIWDKIKNQGGGCVDPNSGNFGANGREPAANVQTEGGRLAKLAERIHIGDTDVEY